MELEDNPNETLAQLDSTEGRIIYVLSILRQRNKMTDEEYNYLQNGILQKDQEFNLVLAICKNKTDFNDIETVLSAQLESIKPAMIEQADDYSPNTHKKFTETMNDSSPLGEMLMYRKQAAENKNGFGGFSLNIMKDM